MQRHIDISALGRMAVIVAGLSLAGCGDSDKAGRINVHLVDGPSLDLVEVNLHVTAVEIASDDGWRTLGTPDVTVNLLALRGGLSETLIDGASLPEGHYGQMRLVLGGGNTVKLADGTVAELTVPSGMQSGVKFNASFDVAAGTTADVFVDFDAHRSIQVHKTGASAKYILRPTVRAFDKTVTGSIAGRIAHAVDGSALAGAVVMAETIDASGRAEVVRSTVTGSDGRYTLDLLPLGGRYHVVTQPVVGEITFEAAASSAIALDATTPVATFDTAVRPTLSGSLTGTITPVVPDAVDVVDLSRSFDIDGGSTLLVVRTTLGVVAGTDETFAFDHVPVGLCRLDATRQAVSAAGEVTVRHTSSEILTMTAGLLLDVDLAF